MAVAYSAAHAEDSLGVAVFDLGAPGEGGASAAAAGLLHPLTTRGGLIWRGREAFESSTSLVLRTQARARELVARGRESEPSVTEGLSGPEFGFAHGVLRVARSEAQATTYRAAAERARRTLAQTAASAAGGAHTIVAKADAGDDALIRWVDAAEARTLIGVDAAPPDCAGGIWCARGLCVDAPAYLRALWDVTTDAAAAVAWCASPLQMVDVRALCEAFDMVVIAVGAASLEVRGLQALPLALVRGQSLCWPSAPAAACPRVGVLGGCYLVPLGHAPSSDGKGGDSCVVGGATFEALIGGVPPDAAASASSLAKLQVDLATLWPAGAAPAAAAAVRPHGMGVRATPPRTQLGSVPITGRVPGERNAWFVTGLGGRGLLYHAELGRTVALAALRDDTGELIAETRVALESSEHRELE
jgi:glycine/D-amino acid oxidase-like deaminating enzyme